MHRFSKALILAGASVALAVTARPTAFATPPDGADTTTVRVQNDRPVRITIYLEQGDFDTRLGAVAANSTATLRLPEAVVREHHEIQIFAHPEGASFDLTGQSFTAQPGSHLELLVPTSAEIVPLTRELVRDPNPANPATTVMVENTRDQAVAVFVEMGDFDTRLGSVPAQQTVTLRIPDWLTDRRSIELFVHPEGGIDLASETMQIRRGTHLHLVVPKAAA